MNDKTYTLIGSESGMEPGTFAIEELETLVENCSTEDEREKTDAEVMRVEAFIQRAINSHDALVEALKKVERWASGYGTAPQKDMREVIREALKLAALNTLAFAVSLDRDDYPDRELWEQVVKAVKHAKKVLAKAEGK